MKRDGATELGLKYKTGQRSWVRRKSRSNGTGSVRRDRQRSWVREKRQATELGPWEEREQRKWAWKIRPDSRAGSVGRDGQRNWVHEKRRTKLLGPWEETEQWNRAWKLRPDSRAGSVGRDGATKVGLKVRPESRAGPVGRGSAAGIGPSEWTGSQRWDGTTEWVRGKRRGNCRRVCYNTGWWFRRWCKFTNSPSLKSYPSDKCCTDSFFLSSRKFLHVLEHCSCFCKNKSYRKVFVIIIGLCSYRNNGSCEHDFDYNRIHTNSSPY